MRKLFLDANILFSAAYQADSGLRYVWQLEESILISSVYAVEEANRNLAKNEQQLRLIELIENMQIVEKGYEKIKLPPDITLRDKYRPIMQATIYTDADFLITGDYRDFGRYFDKEILGVKLLTPASFITTYT